MYAISIFFTSVLLGCLITFIVSKLFHLNERVSSTILRISAITFLIIILVAESNLKYRNKIIKEVRYDLAMNSEKVLEQDEFILLIDGNRLKVKTDEQSVKYVKNFEEKPYLLLNKISNKDNSHIKYELLEVHY